MPQRKKIFYLQDITFGSILDATHFITANQMLHAINLLSLKNYFYVLFLKIVMHSFSFAETQWNHSQVLLFLLCNQP